MRLLVAVALVFASLAPVASAEFGTYDEHGYPIAVDGSSTYPAGIVPAGGIAMGPLNVAGPVTVYPYYPVLTAEVQRLALEHPDLVRLDSMGTTTLGLEMWILEIADFARIESGEGIPLEEREVVWVDGGTHSNEYSGVYFAAHLASFLADGYGVNETATWIVENRHVWIAPLINPDGSHAFGRLNANLVNINRNYPVIWDGEGHDAIMNNRGPEPASELETRHNIEWFNKTRPDYYASVHCCGNLWLYPYGEEGVDPLDDAMLRRVCAEGLPDVGDKCGPIWSTIYPASGSSVDTVYEYTGAVAFGYEMSGRGAIATWGQPFTSESVEVQEAESWAGVMHALLNVEKYGAHLVVEAAEAADGALRLSILNDGYGNLNGGSVELAGESAAIPFLAPGERVAIELPEPDLAEGDARLMLSYAKRIQAGPMRVDGVTLTLAAVEGALRVTAIDGEPLLGLAAAVGPAANGVPGLGLSIAITAVVGIALARRR